MLVEYQDSNQAKNQNRQIISYWYQNMFHELNDVHLYFYIICTYSKKNFKKL